ncbi:MAG: tetratricopeptide repeat protein [Flavobacteriaceae bacterium]|nr:tetratricopeptide repeat protein [Flavobacteriaceae bacterium]
MKLYSTFFLAIFICFGLVAQKKELKSIQKLVDNKSYKEALSQLEANSSLLNSAEPKYASHYYYLLGVSNQGEKAFSEAIDAYGKARATESAAKLKKYSALIDEAETALSTDLVNHAVSLNGDEKFTEAAEALYLAYTLDMENNKDYLYFAASSAVNGGDYDNALSYYLTLKDLNYTGVSTKYYATEVATGEETEIDLTTYKIYSKTKDFTLREELTPSRLPEIVKNIALIHLNRGDNETAMAAVKEARNLAPKDIGLILTEADLFIKMGDEQRFAALMQEAIEQDPNNAVLYFNLGVVSSNQGSREEAIAYYKKAIELDPAYEATYLNLASMILEGESDIVAQMNALGTSAADNRKYDVLKAKREGLFLEAVPFLEQLIVINPTSIDALTTLKNIYGTIGDTANFKKYRDLLESL